MSEPDKKTSLNNRLAKLYALKEPNVNPLVFAQVVDALLMRLARHVTLPIEDTLTLRDVLDRKTDLDLKRAQSAAGGTCRPAIALAAVGRVISSWTSDIEKLILKGAEQEKVITTSRTQSCRRLCGGGFGGHDQILHSGNAGYCNCQKSAMA